MKTALKLLLAAILSFMIGVAFASPLLVTELKIKPWIHTVRGETAPFGVNVVYANLTLQNADVPVGQKTGPTLSYFAVVNVTNLSGFQATLTRLNFVAAEKIAYSSGFPSIGIAGVFWEAEGAWVGGKWFNLTWVNVTQPTFEGGVFCEPKFKLPGEPYWMEGVQIYDRYVNGTLTASYMNMNGTWADITGKIDVARTPSSGSYSSVGTPVLVDCTQGFESLAMHNYSSNGIAIGPSRGPSITVFHLVGEGYFNNYWDPYESRLVALVGSWDVRVDSGVSGSGVDKLAEILQSGVSAIQSGKLMFKTQTSNFAEESMSFAKNTVTTTSSNDVELKHVELTKNENSYIYSPLFLDDEAFQIDKWGLEVKLRSQTP